MAVRVYYKNDQESACTIRPAPLCSISREIQKTAAGDSFGLKYNITLTGTLLADQGTPYAEGFDFYNGSTPNLVGPLLAFDNSISHTDNNKPPKQVVSNLEALKAILSKQRALEQLFSRDGQLLEITDFGTDLPAITCYPRFISIDFQEGIYVDKCDYTITLECDELNESFADDQALLDSFSYQNNQYFPIDEFSETWDLETDEGNPQNNFITRSYRLTHNISAKGKSRYKRKEGGSEFDVDRDPPWLVAKKFVQSRLQPLTYPNKGAQLDALKLTGHATQRNNIPYPNTSIFGNIGQGTINLINTYQGFNHVRNENIDVTNGTYGITETWLLASDIAFETFSSSYSTTQDQPFSSITIDGKITGLTPFGTDNQTFGGTNEQSNPNQIEYLGLPATIPVIQNSKYANALKKFLQLSNNLNFDINSLIYTRANGGSVFAVNPYPLSISYGINDAVGEITYNVTYDTRPISPFGAGNTQPGSESIQVNDTYPGDVFAVIPVLGRKTGPVLQNIGGRTEYKRSISISFTIKKPGFIIGQEGWGRDALLLKKPSIQEPMKTQLTKLINELSPAKEPGVRKWYIDPPTESWDPLSGNYSINITWTYELDK